MNYIRVVKLSHDAGLTQKVSPLFVCITSFQRLDGHTDLSLARHFETPTADFTKLTFGRETELTMDQKRIQDERVIANICECLLHARHRPSILHKSREFHGH